MPSLCVAASRHVQQAGAATSTTQQQRPALPHTILSLTITSPLSSPIPTSRHQLSLSFYRPIVCSCPLPSSSRLQSARLLPFPSFLHSAAQRGHTSQATQALARPPRSLRASLHQPHLQPPTTPHHPRLPLPFCRFSAGLVPSQPVQPLCGAEWQCAELCVVFSSAPQSPSIDCQHHCHPRCRHRRRLLLQQCGRHYRVRAAADGG